MTFDSLKRLGMGSAIAFGLVLGGPSCVTHTDGVEAHVGVRSATTPAVYQTDLGYDISIDTAYLAFASAELLPCASTRALDLFEVGVARAHTASSPTELGVPYVLDLVAALGQEREVGVLLPPPGAYCGLVFDLAPADADAVGLPTEVDMVGRTVLVTGTLTPPGGVPRAFELSSSGEGSVELSFDAPVELSLEASLLSAVVTTDHLAWLDGIEFDTQSPAEQADALFAHLLASLGIEVEAL